MESHVPPSSAAAPAEGGSASASASGPLARTDELLPSWMTSVLVAWVAGDPRVVVGPGAGDLPADPRGTATEVLHVLTSQDPLGEEQAPERNDALLAELLAWAQERAAADGWRWWPVTGGDVHSGHAEQGIGISGMDRAGAVEAGERWRQLAIYELTGEEVRVVPSHGGVDAGIVTAAGPRRWDAPPPDGLLPDAATTTSWWRGYERAAALAGVRVP